MANHDRLPCSENGPVVVTGPNEWIGIASWQVRHDATSLAVSNGKVDAGAIGRTRGQTKDAIIASTAALYCPVIGDNRLYHR